MQVMTVEEAINWRNRTSKEEFFARGSTAQKQRESWCVARMCEILSLSGSIQLQNEEPTDIQLKTSNGTYNIQVTEVKEQTRRFQWSPEWSADAIRQMIIDRVNAKRNYDEQSASKMTLLVYVNLGNGEGNEEFWEQKKVEQLESDFQSLPFMNIIILDPHYGVSVVKGSVR